MRHLLKNSSNPTMDEWRACQYIAHVRLERPGKCSVPSTTLVTTSEDFHAEQYLSVFRTFRMDVQVEVLSVHIKTYYYMSLPFYAVHLLCRFLQNVLLVPTLRL